jgi:uncharacterized membrane protein
MKSVAQNKTNRRNFFSILGKSSLGTMLLAVLPSNIFMSTQKYNKLKKVEINKPDVKRNFKQKSF